MGNGTLKKMESITSEKKRYTAFRNKRATLIKSLHEITVLCDVKACMIIYYGPKQQPLIWPENFDEVQGLIDEYKTKEKEEKSGRNKTFGLSEFFKDKKKKVEHDLANLRKQKVEARYPSWFESLEYLTEFQLRAFAENLGSKAALVKSRIEKFRRNKEAVDRLMCQGQDQVMDLMNFDWTLANFQQGNPSLMPNEMLLPYVNYPTPCANNEAMSCANQNSIMNMLTNTNGDEFGSEFFDPVNFESLGPVGWYNRPSMIPPMQMQPYLQPPGYHQFPSM